MAACAPPYADLWCKDRVSPDGRIFLILYAPHPLRPLRRRSDEPFVIKLSWVQLRGHILPPGPKMRFVVCSAPGPSCDPPLWRLCWPRWSRAEGSSHWCFWVLRLNSCSVLGSWCYRTAACLTPLRFDLLLTPMLFASMLVVLTNPSRLGSFRPPHKGRACHSAYGTITGPSPKRTCSPDSGLRPVIPLSCLLRSLCSIPGACVDQIS